MSRYTSQDGKMARFDFCASQILDLGGGGGGGWGFAVPFYFVQDCSSTALLVRCK